MADQTFKCAVASAYAITYLEVRELVALSSLQKEVHLLLDHRMMNRDSFLYGLASLLPGDAVVRGWPWSGGILVVFPISTVP